METVKLHVQRYDPNNDEAPYWVEYDVPRRDRMRVLDALEYVLSDLGEDLSFEWYCGVRKCGLCTITMNDRPILSCWEPVEEDMWIKPLDGLPVIRDLVTDRSAHNATVTELAPGYSNSEEPDFPEPIPASELHDTMKLSECTECLACTSACPAMGDGFAGPAALVQLARFTLDPRNPNAGAGRIAKEVGLIDQCISCHRCTDVCPEDIPVLETAIEGLRARAIDEGIRQVFPEHLHTRK